MAVGGCNQAQVLDVFVQPAQGSPFAKPNATAIFPNTFPGCLFRGLLLLSSAPHSLSAHCNGKGSPVPAGNFCHGRCLVQFSLIELQLLTQGQAGPLAQREAMQKAQG